MRFIVTVTHRGEYYRYFMCRYFGPEGVVLGPRLPPGHRLREGDALQLRRPDRSVIRTRVDGLLATGPRPEDVEIKLSRLIILGDVPRGTEVWALEEGDRSVA